MPFVADDLGAWLVASLADAGRRKLTVFVLGDEQERAVHQAASAAIKLAAEDLSHPGAGRAEELALVLDQVFAEPRLHAADRRGVSLLETLQEGVSAQVMVLGDRALTGSGQSSADILGLDPAAVATALAAHLVGEITRRGARGGPLAPLASQLNHDVTHLQGQRLEGMLAMLAAQVHTVLAGTALVPLPAGMSPAGRSLPPDTTVFGGRGKEIHRIAAAADVPAGGGIVAIHAISGMPGIGKTALAVHAAHLLKARFPDRQLFIDLRAHTPGQDPFAPGAALAVLLACDGLDARYLPEDVDGRARIWRDRMAGKRVLLVLDNAASTAQVTPLLPGDDCLVLVTSRRHLADLPGGTVRIPLDVLPAEEARAMFLGLVPRAAKDSPDAIAELVRLAGFLPLAISLLARVYSKHPSWTLTDLVAETAGLLMMKPESDSIAVAFDLSYRHLDRRQQEFFRRVALHPGTSIGAHAAAALAAVSPAEATGSLEALHGEGLLAEAGYRRYNLHDLIRLYGRTLAEGEPQTDRDQAMERLLDHYQHTAAVAEWRLARQSRSGPYLTASSPAVFAALPDQAAALSWTRSERDNLLACIDYARKAGQHHRVVALTAGIASVLRRDGPWADAITRHADAVYSARQVRDQLSEANALSDLAEVQRLTDDYPNAIQALEKSLQISRDLKDRLGEAGALGDLGTIQHLIGDYRASSRLIAQALSIYEELGDKRGMAYILGDLGEVYRLTGDYPNTRFSLERALEISRELGDQLGQAYILGNLGALSRQTSNYRAGISFLEESLRLCRDVGDRLGEAFALVFLGGVRRMIGDYPGAGLALEQALHISRDLGDRYGESSALTYLAEVRGLTGDYPEALGCLGQVLNISLDLGDRLGEANAFGHMGAVRRMTGDYRRAQADLDKALTIYRDIGEPGGEADVLNELGALYRVSGDISRSADCHAKALEIARELQSSWDEANALAGLGRCELSSGRVAEGTAMLTAAWETFQRIEAAETAEAAEVAAELDALDPT